MQANTLKTEFSREEQIRKALDNRQQAWMGLFAKRSAMLSEIMEADFGTQNPVGLDIDYWPGDHKIDFKKSEISRRFMGGVNFDFPQTVQFHPIFRLIAKLPIATIRKNFADMLAHETIHSRQGIELRYGLWRLHDGTFLENVPAPETKQAKAQVDKLEKDSLRSSFGRYKIVGYLDEKIEIQARMHEIVSNAYHDWGRMPIIPIEFLAAMYHAGIKVPQETVDDLHEIEEGKKALYDFKLNPITKEAVKRPVSLLNRVNDYAQVCKTSLETWENWHLYYYAGLLELYGDTKGRARMSGDPSLYPVKKVLKNVFDCKNLDDAKIKALSKEIPDFHILGFILALTEHKDAKKLVKAFVQEFKNQGRALSEELKYRISEFELSCQ